MSVYIEDVHVFNNNTRELDYQVNSRIEVRKQQGYEIKQLNFYKGQEWDYPNYKDIIGYSLVFEK